MYEAFETVVVLDQLQLCLMLQTVSLISNRDRYYAMKFR